MRAARTETRREAAGLDGPARDSVHRQDDCLPQRLPAIAAIAPSLPDRGAGDGLERDILNDEGLVA